MNDILYRNAEFYQNEILPYFFLLESKKYIMLIKTSGHDFSHLVGKQYSKNFFIARMKTKEFFRKILNKEIKYDDLINFDREKYSQEYNWIQNKNTIFIELFSSFINEINLKMYKNSNHELYTNIDLDYYHQKGNENISILGIKGSDEENSFVFNSILSNDDEDLIKRFSKNKQIFIIKNHKVRKLDINKAINKIGLNLKDSPRNTYNQRKKSSKTNNILTNQDIKCINRLLLGNLSIEKGENGKKSIKITRNKVILEKGIRLDLKNLDTCEKIAYFINETYGFKN
ncbi:hypothetical protein [Thomasclavelia sp.]|uniref:hypothetical protein n=1 Tax=Thomasclavelia sp. TaxID=3025757 RepID=UPI002600C787|nr:hypothetical protein [Thomasclavelia sp.]